MTFSKLTALCVLAAVSLLPQQAPAQDAAEPQPPNIIYIMADDLGYGDLGCYGQQQIQSPNIDRLAAEGLRFTDCYAGSTVCAPSRCALMTGLHTGHCLVRRNWLLPLRPQDITVAEVLQGAGYDTALVGKWGLGEAGTTGAPNNQGFGEFFGYLNQVHAHNYYPEFLWHNDQRHPLDNVVVRPARNPNSQGGVASRREDYSHDLFTEAALRYIDEHREGPFFLYLAYTIPHANNEASRQGMEVPSLDPYADKDWPEPQKAHAAMITRMDRDVGRLMAKLKELGIDERTVLLFTSDNGPHKEGGADPEFFNSSGPLRGYKRSMHDGGIRVPMIVRQPGRIEAGRTTDHVCAFWDFLPTAAELAGADAPEGLDGISFVPTLYGGEQPRHDYLYWEFHESGIHQAVRHGRWKAVRKQSLEAPLELYDLSVDLGEQNNVAADHPQIVQQIEAYLETARTPEVRLEGAGG
jgi:uncharacterized sulfatase